MFRITADHEWTLETERLRLAPMTVNDAAELNELHWPPESDAPVKYGSSPSLEDFRARIRRWEHRRSPDGAEVWLNWTLRQKHDQSIVGRMQATVTECRADMAWVIGRRHRNRGYATEAGRCIAAWLPEFFDLEEVRATINPDNTVSQRVAANVGLRRSGEWTGDGDEVWARRL